MIFAVDRPTKAAAACALISTVASRGARMKIVAYTVFIFAIVGAMQSFSRDAADKKPMAMALECAGGDCPLLKGAPQTAGMRGGNVRLKPGASVGWHSTEQNEEALVILRGAGAANIEGQPDLALSEHQLAYIPPQTKHNVTNTGAQEMEYVWIVAPAQGQAK
jgi:quercetin dioxygenase-like cupin family protein